MSSVFRRPWLLRYCQSIVCARVPEDALQHPGVVHAQIRKVDVPSRRLLISDTHACIWAKLSEECMNDLSRFRTNLVELVGGIIQLSGFELKISVPDLDPTGQGTWAELMKFKASQTSVDQQQEEMELILNVWAMDYNGGDEIEVQGDPLICSRDNEIVIALRETPLGELQNRMRTRQRQQPSQTTTTTTTTTTTETPGKWKPSWDLDSFCAIAEETRQADRSRLIEVYPSEPGSELQEEDDAHQSPEKAKSALESSKQALASPSNHRVYASTESSNGGHGIQTEDSMNSSQDESGYVLTGEVEVKPRGGGQSSTPPATTKHVSFAIRTPLQGRLKDPRDLSEEERLQNPKLGKFIKRKSDFSPAVRVTPSKKIPSESPLAASSGSASIGRGNTPVRTPQATVALVEVATNRSPSKKKVVVVSDELTAPAGNHTTSASSTTTNGSVLSSNVVVEDGKMVVASSNTTASTTTPSTAAAAATNEGQTSTSSTPTAKASSSSSTSTTATTPKSSSKEAEQKANPNQNEVEKGVSNVSFSAAGRSTPSLQDPVAEGRDSLNTSPPTTSKSVAQQQTKKSTNLDVLASAVLEEEAKRSSSPVKVASGLNNNNQPILAVAAGSPGGLEQDEPIMHDHAEDDEGNNNNNDYVSNASRVVMASASGATTDANQASEDDQKASTRGRVPRRQLTASTGSEVNADNEMADTESEATCSSSDEDEEAREEGAQQQQQQQRRQQSKAAATVTGNGSGAFAIVGKMTTRRQAQQQQAKRSVERLGPLTQKGDEEEEDESEEEEEADEENGSQETQSSESTNAKPKRDRRKNQARNGSEPQQTSSSSSSQPSTTKLDGPLTQMPHVDEEKEVKDNEKQQPLSQSASNGEEEDKDQMADEKRPAAQQETKKKKGSVVAPVRRSKRFQLGPLTQAGAVEEEDEVDEDETVMAGNTERQSQQSQSENQDNEIDEDDGQGESPPKESNQEDEEEDESPLVSSMDIEPLNGVKSGKAIRPTTTTTTTTTTAVNASPSRTRKSTAKSTSKMDGGGRSSTSSSSAFKLKKTVFTSLPRISVNTKSNVNWVAEGGPGYMKGMEEGDQIVSVQGKKELKQIRLALENGPLPLEIVWRSLHPTSDDDEEESDSISKEEEDRKHGGHSPQTSSSNRSRVVVMPTTSSPTTTGTRRRGGRQVEQDDLVGKRYEHFWGGMVYYGEVVVRTNKDEYLLRDVDGAEQIVDRVQAQRLVSGELRVPHEHIRDPTTRQTKCVSPQQPQQQPKSFKLVVPPPPSSPSAAASAQDKNQQQSSASKSKSPAATSSMATATGRSLEQQQQQGTKRVKLMRKKLTMIDEQSEDEAETISWEDFKRMRQKGAGSRQ